MNTIQIPVDAEALRAYRSATQEEQQRIHALLNVWLKGLEREPTRPLSKVMDDIGRKAQDRGLTQEILDDLLRDE